MLQPIDAQRFEWLKKQVDRLGIRFPVAEIAQKTGFDEGNISSFLKGKKPYSDKFLTKFKEAYKIDADGDEPTPMQILAVLADAFRDQAALMRSIESKMARADALATVDTNLIRTLAGVERIAIVQDRSQIELLDYLARIKDGKDLPSQGEDRKKHRTDANGRKRGKSPA